MEFNYSEAVAEIEAILNRFRTDKMSVDDLTREVKRAKELIAQCRERLTNVESDLKTMLEQ